MLGGRTNSNRAESHPPFLAAVLTHADGHASRQKAGAADGQLSSRRRLEHRSSSRAGDGPTATAADPGHCSSRLCFHLQWYSSAQHQRLACTEGPRRHSNPLRYPLQDGLILPKSAQKLGWTHKQPLSPSPSTVMFVTWSQTVPLSPNYSVQY